MVSSPRKHVESTVWDGSAEEGKSSVCENCFLTLILKISCILDELHDDIMWKVFCVCNFILHREWCNVIWKFDFGNLLRNRRSSGGDELIWGFKGICIDEVQVFRQWKRVQFHWVRQFILADLCKTLSFAGNVERQALFAFHLEFLLFAVPSDSLNKSRIAWASQEIRVFVLHIKLLRAKLFPSTLCGMHARKAFNLKPRFCIANLVKRIFTWLVERLRNWRIYKWIFSCF